MKVIDMLKKYSQPELREEQGGMVLEIWEDGEETSQKCGDLYGHRTLHQSSLPIVPGWFGDQYIEHMDERSRGKHGCIAVTHENSKKIRAAMLEEYIEWRKENPEL